MFKKVISLFKKPSKWNLSSLDREHLHTLIINASPVSLDEMVFMDNTHLSASLKEFRSALKGEKSSEEEMDAFFYLYRNYEKFRRRMSGE